ncbi:MAG: 50S ribosomal protein L32 [Planctomycetaceae bacterium]|jgi:large subunit ribosomal protein L32|nr:50S ribosomal protein L32 [Planctomycetaceae bacterium]
MAVPKRKHSNARTGSRRSHDHKEMVQITYCTGCSTAIMTHVICPKCGTYMDRKIVEPKVKKNKRSSSYK